MNNIKLLSLEEVNLFERDTFNRIAETASKLSVDDEKLALKETVLHFSSTVEGHTYTIEQDLAGIWVPGSGGFEHPVPLLLYPHHAKTIVNAIDIYAQGVGHTPSFTKGGATSVMSNIIKFIEWALLKDHYQLGTISKSDIKSFCNEMKKGGIPNLLQLPNRFDILWENIKNDIELIKIILTEPTKKYGYRSLNLSLIKKMIGTSSLQGMVPNKFYKLVGHELRSSGISVIDYFEGKGTMGLSQPSAKTLNTLFGQWNSLSRVDGGDSISFFPFKDPYSLSNKLGKPTGRTKNIGTEQVIKLLGEASLWLNKASPLIIKAVKEITDLRNEKGQGKNRYQRNRYIIDTLYPKRMAESQSLNDIEKTMGFEISRDGPRTKETNSEKWTLTECITALMSACFIILQIYNARRQAEISDPIIGIAKEEHFHCKYNEFGWYQAEFYNEKQGGRYWHTINKSSTQALKVLFELKKSWDSHGHNGLFNIPRFNIDAKNNMSALKYQFNKGKDSSYTGNKFLERALGDDVGLAKGTHIFRRIYAIIYHYQYEHRDLLALCHQLGHIDPEVTEVYVTDPVARNTHETLQKKVKLNQPEETSSAILVKAENKALDKIIQEVDTEKTASDILDLMMGTKSMAGRYPSFLKRVFKILHKSVKFNEHMKKKHKATFSKLTPNNQSLEMAKIISERGHKNQPKPHSSCHRQPNKPKSHDAPCDPLQCKGCAYQDVKKSHLDIMKEDLMHLRAVANNGEDYMPLERMQATEQANNIEHVVTQHERTMQHNDSLFTGF
ncbi:hypothetical protein H4J50_10190 [Colwellia sp. 6M3]|jgi:hypothetical protein|uniref:hypothetical protein n=1 Tax=Colwellia sp. 6M3 TaxID=2759849 RepID=UPI0015F72CE9|nr:hypothetical protein [Colwellia sp. 6M3]MBA6416384.1 hypothetical protein [Colwellia sp. 6M3]